MIVPCELELTDYLTTLSEIPNHIQVHLKKIWISWVNIFCQSFQKVKPIYWVEWIISSLYFLIFWWLWLTDNENPKFRLRKLEYYIRSIKKDILNRNVRLLKSMLISMHSILGWSSFCMNYCINAAWHGGNQPVALLRCNGSPGCFDSGLQVICIVGSGVSHLPLDNIPYILYGVQVRWVCWPIKHSNTMVIEPAFGTFGSVGRCQVLLLSDEQKRKKIMHILRQWKCFLTLHACQPNVGHSQTQYMNP